MLSRFLEESPRSVLSMETGTIEMAYTDGLFCYADVAAKLDLQEGGCHIQVSAQKTPVKTIAFYWKISIEPTVRILGDHWERSYGDLEWRGIVPERVMPWYFLAHDEGKTTGIGVKTGSNALCYWQLSRDTLALYVDIRNGGSGVLLQGRCLDAATVVIHNGCEGVSAFATAKEFCKKMCDQPVMPSKPVYGGNNWYYAYGSSTRGKILEDSKFISSLSDSPDNRPYMVIDDGWQLCRNAGYIGGPWHMGNKGFPHMETLAGEMKRQGVKPGIWMRPTLTIETFESHQRLPYSRFLNPDAGDRHFGYLDPSIPEVLGQIASDTKRMVDWGFELIKFDFSTFDFLGRWGFEMNSQVTNDNWCFQDRSKTTMEIILAFYRTIQKASGDVDILACNTIGHAVAGIFAIQRTGDDTSGQQWERTRKMGVNTLAFRSMQHGTFFSADADCVGITKDIPWALNKQWLSLVANSGTPLFVSIDPAYADESHKKSLRSAFTVAAQQLPLVEPIDWLHTSCPSEYMLNGETRRFYWDMDEWPK